METLAAFVSPTNLETFLTKHFTRLPFSSRGGGQSFSRLLTLEILRSGIERKTSMLRVVKDGRVIKDGIDLTWEEALAYFRSGHTLLLRFAERSDEALLKVAQEFETYFKTPVDVQLYCTPDGHNAFGWHYDVEEVFILQTKGSKEYSIRQNTLHPFPLVKSIPQDMGYEKEKSDLEVKVLLEEGDFLYIPSGWWHRAVTRSESLHISIGLMPVSAVDLVISLEEYLPKFPFWRTRLPIHQEFSSEEEELTFYQEAFTKLGQDLAQKFSKPEFVREFLMLRKSKIYR